MSAEGAIREVIERLVDTWNRRDWPSFSRLFAEDADYVTGAAVRLAGRGRIHDEFASRAENSVVPGRVSLVAESVKCLRPDVAVVLCRWQMGGHDGGRAKGPDERSGLLTMVMQAEDGDWRIVALHNTDRTG